MMEDETGFLSRDDEKEELKLERITKLLSNILTDLNDKKVTTIIGIDSIFTEKLKLQIIVVL